MIKPVYIDENVSLYLGDSMRIAPELGKFDMIFTDPPYGHNNNDGDLIHNLEVALGRRSKPKKARPIKNDGAKSASALAMWLFGFARFALKESGAVCCCCCCCGGGPDPQFARWSKWADAAMEFVQMVVWDKGPMGLGWHYRRSYEVVLVAKVAGKPTPWFDDTHRVENIIRPGSGIRKCIPKAGQHPTQKPVELAEHFIRLHTRRGGIVLDPFCGAGTTLVAAKRAGRRAVGIELDPKWIPMAVSALKAEKGKAR